MLRTFDRQPRLVASMIVTALLLAVSAINPFSGGIALAVPAGTTDAVQLACNNTFAPTKFPLEYDVIAHPSANPIAPGATFSVTFDVTVVMAASFLNGVYAALTAAGQAVGAVPITELTATVTPLTGATGPNVSAKVIGTKAAPAFTVPAPASVPVTAGVSIHIGSVVGNYTADATGPVSFAIAGNSWQPAIPATATAAAIPADPLPAAFTEFGWNTAVVGPPAKPITLNPSGQQTYVKTSLLNGLVTPYLICMGGSWTSTPPPAATPTANPTFGLPLVPPVGFASFQIGTGPPITEPAAATTTTATPVATTVPPATTAPAATTTTAALATTTTTGSTVPTTTIPAVPITGTATYTADCADDVLPEPTNHHPITYKLTATALSPVAKGGTITITNQEWQVVVPEALVTTLKPLLTANLDATATGTLSATNVAAPNIKTSPTLTSSTPLPASGDLTTTVHPPDVSFTATGGDVVIAFAGATNAVALPALAVTANLTCVPTGAIPALLTIVVPGDSPPTTAPTATTAPAVTATTARVAALSPVVTASIPRTGSNSSVLWVELFGGLLIIQFGIMFWSAGQGRRRRRAS